MGYLRYCLNSLPFSICLIISSLGFVTNGKAQVTTSPNQGNPYKVLDASAVNAKRGDDASMHGLADAVFSFPRMLPRLPDILENPIKDRLVIAEFAFRQNTRSGVREEDIVQLVNTMADKLKVPGYAKTNLKQVRVLRMQLMLASPVFMTQGVDPAHLSPGEHIGSTLSPLQAVHLINSLIDQKLINPDFQLEPEEWEKKQVDKQTERIKAAQELLRSSTSGQSDQSKGSRSRIVVQKRKRDLHDALIQAGENLSVLDAMDLIDNAFTTLKLKN